MTGPDSNAYLVKILGETHTTTASDPLFAAIDLLGKTVGFTARLPDSAPGGQDDIQAIARASGARRRSIKLGERWWKSDIGPFLGWFGDAQVPVVLLPGWYGSYWMHNPKSGERRRITPTLARQVAPDAECFYALFPDRKLTLKDLLTFGIHASWRDVAVLLLAGNASALLSMAAPYGIGALFTDVVPSGALPELLSIGLALLFATLAALVMDIASGRAQTRLLGRASHQLDAALWDRILRLDPSFVDAMGTGDVAARVAVAQQLQSYAINILHDLATRGQRVIVSIVTLWIVAPWVGLTASGLALVMIAITWAMMEIQTRAIMKGEALLGNLYNQPVEYLNAVSKLRAAGAEERAFQRWARNFSETRRRSMLAGKVSNSFMALCSFFPLVATALVFLVLAHPHEGEQAFTTAATLMALTAFTTFIQSLLPLTQTAMSLSTIQAKRPRLQPLLDTVPPAVIHAAEPGQLDGQVEMNDVCVRYGRSDTWALERVSLKAEPGEFIAVVGPSGSGKSTIVRVLLGLMIPQQGTVMYNGRDLSTMVLDRVRRQIGTVMQNGHLFPGTLRENIAGPFSVSTEEIWEAAYRAAVDEDIKRMPMQLHTLVLDGTAAFSGGQVQRLLLARAFVAKPSLMILDEATSALDAHTQATVVQRMKALRCTRVVIAHRFSTIRDADRVYVVKDGRISESGSVPDLLKSGGYLTAMARAEGALGPSPAAPSPAPRNPRQQGAQALHAQ